MPQLVGLMLLGAGLYAGYKALAGFAAHVADEMTRADEAVRQAAAERAPVREKDLGRLEWDEAAKVYRPAVEHRRG